MPIIPINAIDCPLNYDVVGRDMRVFEDPAVTSFIEKENSHWVNLFPPL